MTVRQVDAGALMAAAAAVLCVGGCGAAPPPPAPPAPAAEARADGVAGPEPRHVDTGPLDRAPRAEGRVVLEAAPRHGDALLPLEGVRPEPVNLQIDCLGEGTLTVRIEPVGLALPQRCVGHEVTATLHRFDLSMPAEGTVRVEAPSGVRWALTVDQ
ncbi:hypothetical protein [Streptomyces sp. NPDC002640]